MLPAFLHSSAHMRQPLLKQQATFKLSQGAFIAFLLSFVTPAALLLLADGVWEII